MNNFCFDILSPFFFSWRNVELKIPILFFLILILICFVSDFIFIFIIYLFLNFILFLNFT